jgi:hypothetical protein
MQIFPNRLPDDAQIHPMVFMNNDVPHRKHFRPWDLWITFAYFLRYMPRIIQFLGGADCFT